MRGLCSYVVEQLVRFLEGVSCNRREEHLSLHHQTAAEGDPQGEANSLHPCTGTTGQCIGTTGYCIGTISQFIGTRGQCIGTAGQWNYQSIHRSDWCV